MGLQYPQSFGQAGSKAAQRPAERLAIIVDVLYFRAHGISPRGLIPRQQGNGMAQQLLRQQPMPCQAIHAPALSDLD